MKMMRLIPALFVCCWCFCGCNGDDEVKKTETPVAVAKAEKINFFMEVSGSMAGYLQGSTAFRKWIPNLLVNMEGKIDSGKLPLKTYYISDSIVPFEGSTQDFINTISTTTVAKGKSSEMHRIFKMVADKTDSNDISVFVSDCILSYPDAVLKQKGNENINSTNAEGELKATITKAFIALQQKGICASVYGFNSGFVGNYYTYQNNKIPLNGDVPRPYYIWVIGRKDLLLHFNRQLNAIEGFQPDHIAIDFGLFEEPVTAYNILFKYERAGEWSTNFKEITEADISEKKPASFAVVLNLSSLPLYAQDTNYLRKNLKKTGTHLDATITAIELTKNVNKAGLKEKEQNLVLDGTHILLCTVSNMYQDQASLGFELPLQYDTSYRNLSVMDDRTIEAMQGKTFALTHLIDGVRAAYQNNNQYFIQISIPVKK